MCSRKITTPIVTKGTPAKITLEEDLPYRAVYRIESRVEIPESADEILNEVGDDELSFDDLHTDGKFFKSAMYAGNHAASLQAVVQGNVDAAAVSSGTYQNQLEEGNFNEEDVKIIHTSPLIPGGPIAVQKDLPQELKDKVRDFLLDYSEEYFTALGEPDKRYVEVEDSTYDYLAELKEEYGLSD